VVFFVLLPWAAFGQGTVVTDADGCVHGRPCAYGVPLPAPNQGTYIVDTDGCVSGQPCPWRGWRSKGYTTTTDPMSGNVYQKQRNADGTTDVLGSNARTGSQWDQHYDPGQGLQSGHNKDGQTWTAPLVQPFGKTLSPSFDFGAGPPNSLDESGEGVRAQLKQEPDAAPSAPSINETQRQAFEAEVARQEAERRDMVMRALVLSRMQPGVLAEAAARAAAQRRCSAITNVSAREACLAE
jgi:hypothetical protein